MIQLIIFDMDGVLVNSEPHYRATNHRLFQELGISMTPEEHQSYVGLDSKAMWTRIAARHGLKEKPEVLSQREIKAQFETLKSEILEPIPGVEDLIRYFKNLGLPLAVGSSSHRHFIAHNLQQTGLASYFDFYASGADLPRSKPDPALFLQIASHFQVPPADCLVIEDSANGIRAAKAAGMQCIAYQNPHSGKQDLSLADAVVSAYTPEAWHKALTAQGFSPWQPL